jgi:sulfatase modifying factor 1
MNGNLYERYEMRVGHKAATLPRVVISLLMSTILLVILSKPCQSAAQAQASQAASQPASRPMSQSTVYIDWPFDAKEAVRRQDETAKSLGVDKDLTLTAGDKFQMKLILIPAGKFMMGTSKEQYEVDSSYYRGPQHEVTLTKPFYMGIYHVTRGQFAAFVADTGYQTFIEKSGGAMCWTDQGTKWIDGASWKNPAIPQGDDHPVYYVKYDDAKAFCAWLSKKTGRTITLPTEAQWEYACRAGTSTMFNTGDTITTDQANYLREDPKSHEIVGFRKNTTPVGSFKPNAFGLYDMHGNVTQWCDDFLGSDYGTDLPKTDPRGDESVSGLKRAVRGGSFTTVDDGISSTYSGPVGPKSHTDFTGFRIICTDLPAAASATQPGR